MSQLAEYRSSGRVSFKGLVLGLGLGLGVGPLLGALYAIVTHLIPVNNFDFVITILFGGVLGFGVARVMSRFHVRNPVVTYGVVVLSALVAHYVGWVVWVLLVVGEVPDLGALVLFFPPALFEIVAEIADVGTWTYRGRAVTGATLWIAWSVELLFVVGAAAIGAFMDTGKRVYCESCQRWCTVHDDVLRFVPTDHQIPGIIGELSRGDFAVLTTLPRAQGDVGRWIQIDVAVCDGCRTTNTFCVAQMRMSRDSKGNLSEESEMLLERRLIAHDAATWLLRFGGVGVAPSTWATT